MDEYKRKFAAFAESINLGQEKLTMQQLQDLLSRLNAILEASADIIRYNLIVIHRRQKDVVDLFRRLEKAKVSGTTTSMEIAQGEKDLQHILESSNALVNEMMVLIRQKAQDIRSVFRSFSTTTTRRSAIDAMKQALEAKGEVKEQEKLVAALDRALYGYMTKKNDVQRAQLQSKIGQLLKDLAANYHGVVQQAHDQIRNVTQIIDFVNGELAEMYRYVGTPAGPGDTGGILCQKGLAPEKVIPLERLVAAVDEHKKGMLMQLAASSDIVAREASRLAAAA